jgi:OTU domain-containing protein 3
MAGLFSKSKKKSFKPANVQAAPASPPKPPPPPKTDPEPPAEPAEEAWRVEMRQQDTILRRRGFFIRPIEADGNCFFRAVADQLGVPDKHAELREQCVDYMLANRDDFEPFRDDTEEESFDSYCSHMRQHSVWAGHMEIQAIARVLNANVLIRRLELPPTEHFNYEEGYRLLHLSYHSGEHYNSVRPLEEEGSDKIVECPTTLAEIRQREKEVAAEEEAAKERADAAAEKAKSLGNMTELKMPGR